MLINSQLCPGVQGMDVIREINARACGLLISDLCNFHESGYLCLIANYMY